MISGRPEEAHADARAAAGRAGVRIVEVPHDRADLVQDVIAEVWGPQQRPQDNLVRALGAAGTGLLVAMRGDECVGVSLAFLGWTDGVHLHSHMTAARPGAQHRGIGFALKLWQRHLCLEHGVTEVRWTYDPLIARNAHFNLVKLGAVVRRFLPDHYGAMDDVVNAGDRSDRFEVSWQLDRDHVTAALVGRLPVPAGRTLVPIPADYDALRRTDPDGARAVRERARAAFADLVTARAAVAWAGAEGGYVIGGVRRDPTP